ncbi:MAG TPA: amidohydrolase family protein [Ilumatobacter sp.]|nr:amidohydrolase family protein [Ilumatobacter sp.]
MLDVVIRGGTVVDGTGSQPRPADVGIRSGRIAALGEIGESATETVDAAGMLVMPGFVDPHTHYDAQLCWDSFATPSNDHGVTSVIGGNCGFALAPLRPEDGDYTRRMMARVEGMPLRALEEGIDWSWRTFEEYLDRLDRGIAVNAGFLVGHCALRRFVMGPAASDREATPDELRAMTAVLGESIRAGGLGLSTSRSSTHSDGDGRPVASRVASIEEVLALCSEVGRHDGTSLEAIVEGCLGRFADDEVELLAEMSARAGRPLNWNVLAIGDSDRDRAEHQLRPSRRAREVGGRVVALTMPVHADMNMSLGAFCSLWLIPGWREVMELPLAEKAKALRDPSVRDRLVAASVGTPFEHRTRFSEYRIGDTFAARNAANTNRPVADIAAEMGTDAFGAIVEIGVADEFRTVLWPGVTQDGDADWDVRRALWDDPDVILGGSDAGAHVDRMLGSNYAARFLADVLRGRRLVSIERAVAMLTSVPAQLFGLRDRGVLRVGAHADVVVADPASVGSSLARRTDDLPGNSVRLVADPIGVGHVFVNGVATIADGAGTGATPGRTLRSGRDTTGTETAAASTHAAGRTNGAGR